MQNTNLTTFGEFRNYCRQAAVNLSNLQGYSAEYKVSSNPFRKEHDGQWLEVTATTQEHIIKLSLVYSIAYSIPTFFFMAYSLDSVPLTAEQIYQEFIHREEQSELHPRGSEGIYLTQHPINQGYYYTLHHCQIALHINRLVPFYFSLVRLHPPLIINPQ